MNSPITPDFDWSILYENYDRTCKRFDRDAPSLSSFSPKPLNDRCLYYDLIVRIARERKEKGFITLGTYEGILYWKLYSQPAAVEKICRRIRDDIARQKNIEKTLKNLGNQLPHAVSEELEEVDRIFQVLQHHRRGLYGLSNSCALPTRSTFLHFLYPSTVPIFDKQVLIAVGVKEKDANKNHHVLLDYIQFAWDISKSPYIPQDWQETPLRLVDMALWVIRDKQNRLKKSSNQIVQTVGFQSTKC